MRADGRGRLPWAENKSELNPSWWPRVRPGDSQLPLEESAGAAVTPKLVSSRTQPHPRIKRRGWQFRRLDFTLYKQGCTLPRAPRPAARYAMGRRRGGAPHSETACRPSHTLPPTGRRSLLGWVALERAALVVEQRHTISCGECSRQKLQGALSVAPTKRRLA